MIEVDRVRIPVKSQRLMVEGDRPGLRQGGEFGTKFIFFNILVIGISLIISVTFDKVLKR